MAKIEITEKNNSGDNLYYLQTSLGEIFNHADCTLRSSAVGDILTQIPGSDHGLLPVSWHLP